MDMTTITTAMTAVEGDLATAAASVISIVLVYAGFKWIKRAING